MKTLRKILFLLASIGPLIACSKSGRFRGEEPLGNTMKGGHNKSFEVTMPTKTGFN